MKKNFFITTIANVLITVSMFGGSIPVFAQSNNPPIKEDISVIFNGKANYRYGTSPVKDSIEITGSVLFIPNIQTQYKLTDLLINKSVTLYLYDKDYVNKINIDSKNISFSDTQLQYNTQLSINAVFNAQNFGFNNTTTNIFTAQQGPFFVKMSALLHDNGEYKEFSKNIPVSQENIPSFGNNSPSTINVFGITNSENTHSNNTIINSSSQNGQQQTGSVNGTSAASKENPFTTQNTILTMATQIKKNQDRYDISGTLTYLWPTISENFPVTGISPAIIVTLVPIDSSEKRIVDKTIILSPTGDLSKPNNITYEFKSWYSSQKPIKEIIIEEPSLQVTNSFSPTITTIQKKIFTKKYPISSYDESVQEDFEQYSNQDNPEINSPIIRGVLKNPLPFNTIPEVVNAFVKGIVIPIAIPLLGIAIMYTGFLFVQARGNETKLKEAKLALKWTLIGGAIILASYVIAEGLQATIKDIMKPQ